MYWEDVSQIWGMATVDPVAPGERVSSVLVLPLGQIWWCEFAENTYTEELWDGCIVGLPAPLSASSKKKNVLQTSATHYITTEPMRVWLHTSEPWMKSNSVSGKSPTRGTYWGPEMHDKLSKLRQDKHLPGPPSPSGTRCQQLGGCSWQWSARSSRRGRCCWSPPAPAWPRRRWRRWRRRSLLWSPPQNWSPWDLFKISAVLKIQITSNSVPRLSTKWYQPLFMP